MMDEHCVFSEFSQSRCTFFALHVINPKKDFKQSDEGGGGTCDCVWFKAWTWASPKDVVSFVIQILKRGTEKKEKNRDRNAVIFFREFSVLELPELATTSLSKVLPTQVEPPFKLDTEDDGRLTKQSVRQHFVLRILNGVLIMPPLGIIAFHFIPHQCNLFSLPKHCYDYYFGGRNIIWVRLTWRRLLSTGVDLPEAIPSE